jgi:hypothetical protein
MLKESKVINIMIYIYRNCYHEDCLLKWMRKKDICPVCKQEILNHLPLGEEID